MTEKKQSVNPFYSMYEGVLKPIKVLNHFVQHSLDDATEDAVTVIGMGVFAFTGVISLPIKIITSPLIYYGVKRAADFSGEFVEGLLKTPVEEAADAYDGNNFAYELIDDITEDVSKAVCVASNNIPTIAVAVLAHSVGATGCASVLKSTIELGFASYGYTKDYNECNELANAHGHWAVDQAKAFMSYLGYSQDEVVLEPENANICPAQSFIDELTTCMGEVAHD